ncbi:MAG: hypothetical protein PF495_10650 [Spirochaetales bacterium]|jgi:hypothetical protein|nr:hypothetical protein [Spirochaetales bacterium]
MAQNVSKTKDCMDDMDRDNLYEADVEKVIMDAITIEKAMPATSERASSANNTHYVIQGTSINGAEIYCKVCSNYHPQTNNFLGWKLTSFANK